MRVERRHEQAIAEHGEAAVDRAAAELQVVGKVAAIAPDLRGPMRASIAHALLLKPVTYSTPSMHDAASSGSFRAAPVWNVHCAVEPVDVLGRDLRERAVALAVVGAGVGQPARRILQSVEQILRCDGRRRRRRRRGRRRRASSPRSEAR